MDGLLIPLASKIRWKLNAHFLLLFFLFFFIFVITKLNGRGFCNMLLVLVLVDVYFEKFTERIFSISTVYISHWIAIYSDGLKSPMHFATRQKHIFSDPFQIGLVWRGRGWWCCMAAQCDSHRDHIFQFNSIEMCYLSSTRAVAFKSAYRIQIKVHDFVIWHLARRRQSTYLLYPFNPIVPPTSTTPCPHPESNDTEFIGRCTAIGRLLCVRTQLYNLKKAFRPLSTYSLIRNTRNWLTQNANLCSKWSISFYCGCNLNNVYRCVCCWMYSLRVTLSVCRLMHEYIYLLTKDMDAMVTPMLNVLRGDHHHRHCWVDCSNCQPSVFVLGCVPDDGSIIKRK